MKKIISFILLVAVVILSCNSGMGGDNDEYIKKDSDSITFVFSSNKVAKESRWIKSHIREIENEVVLIKNISKNGNRNIDGHTHNIIWTNEVVHVYKFSNDITKIYKYQFGVCKYIDCSYQEARLIGIETIIHPDPTDPQQTSLNYVDTSVIKKIDSEIFLVFSSKEAEKELSKMKDQINCCIEEVRNDSLTNSTITIKNGKIISRNDDSGHNMVWRKYYVEVNKIGAGIIKVYKYQFGYCTDCDYAKYRLVSVKVIYEK